MVPGWSYKSLCSFVFTAPDLKYRQQIKELETRKDVLSQEVRSEQVDTVIAEINENIKEFTVNETQYKSYKDSISAGTIVFTVISAILGFCSMTTNFDRVIITILFACIGFAVNFLLKERLIWLCCPRISPTMYSIQTNAISQHNPDHPHLV